MRKLIVAAREMNGSAEQLCLQCGLCCNGVIFADGELQPDDDTARLENLGLKLKRGGKFHQPCAVFVKGCCGIYADRPSYCRAFECALLKSVEAGKISADRGVIIIRKARSRATRVDLLLRKLGDTHEHLALALRFRRTSKRMNEAQIDAGTARLFGELTVAMHRLNLLLSQKFNPQ
ncbi:MAG TPA: YkgJ family cysteine cluster protein [Candidatus Acidoferrum sp.]|nr:YkgJ family cysteine cluster protein [Candidatus Acidoferrum sp.]